MEEVAAVALDVDGVLTDGTVGLSPGGEEQKSISFRDVMGISLGRRAGLRFCIISGEGGPLLQAIASKLSISDVYAHCKDKAAALRSFVDAQQLTLEQVCFMGDDVNDLPALKIAGFSAAPPSAHASVLEAVHHITKSPAGNGAVRELIDMLLASRASADLAAVEARA